MVNSLNKLKTVEKMLFVKSDPQKQKPLPARLALSRQKDYGYN
jgi:hypothetical protein